jgi:subtilase family serine protease
MRTLALAVPASLLVLGVTAAGAAGASTSHPASAGQAFAKAMNKPDYQRACAAARAGHFACMALVRTNVPQRLQPIGHPDAAPLGYGYGPSSLQSAYKLPSTGGSGQTVAVVDAYNDPNAVSDLATYRSAWGQAACNATTKAGCLTVVNQNGAASPLPANAGSSGWDVEESLDVDMVSAICPNCHIYLVEVTSPTDTNLGTGVNSAVNLGAKFVSNSYGGPESSSDSSFDTAYYNHPGVAVTASAGDDGYGVSYPAASRYVTSVGGTSLSTASNSRGWTETVWGSSAGGEGTGSGCSVDDAKPSWQTDTGCARRTDNDVSADANPNTGVAVYDTYSEGGWLEVGGTSASSPMIAATFALAGTPASGTYPSSYIYAHTSSLFDVTSGSNGSCSPAYLCHGETGYDGPTGWGTPNGVTAFTSGSTGSTGILQTGQVLHAGQTLTSPNGRYGLVMQTDGNLVAYDSGRAIWASNTYGTGSANYLIMQTDGNAVVYTSAGHAVWASNTNGTGSANYLAMQTDGNVVVYTSAGRAVWASNTAGQ